MIINIQRKKLTQNENQQPFLQSISFLTTSFRQGTLIGWIGELNNNNNKQIIKKYYNNGSLFHDEEFMQSLMNILKKLLKFQISIELTLNLVLEPEFFKNFAKPARIRKAPFKIIEQIVPEIIGHLKTLSKDPKKKDLVGREKKDKKLSRYLRRKLLPSIERILNIGFKTKKTFGQNYLWDLFETVAYKAKENLSIIGSIKTNVSYINNARQIIGKSEENKFIALMVWGLNDQQLHLYFKALFENISLVSKFLDCEIVEYHKRIERLSQALEPLAQFKLKIPIDYKLKK